MAGRFLIVGGPDKFDLMLSLFDGKKVKFFIEQPDGGKNGFPPEFEINILSVEAEDGSRESWDCVGNSPQFLEPVILLFHQKPPGSSAVSSSAQRKWIFSGLVYLRKFI